MTKQDTSKLAFTRDRLLRQVKHEFPDLEDEEVAFSLITLEKGLIARAGYREDMPIYPASIIKLFYAVAAYHWVEEGHLKKTEEFDRAMRDMIVDSSNDATSYLIDLMTGTTSGPELADKAMSTWMAKRNAINQHFASRGFSRVNINQKPWGDGPYGREKVFVGSESGGRNMLTTGETATLLLAIMQEMAVEESHGRELLTYLARDRSIASDDTNSQSLSFLGARLPTSIPSWSKAGWTSQVRHDAAGFRLPEKDVVCVLFTEKHSRQPEIIHRFGELLLQAVQS